MHPLEAHQVLSSLHPMGRMGEVSDIVDAVMYLDSAGFVTGEILHVDGGQAAGHHTIYWEPFRLFVGCACRKSTSHIQMMKSAKKWRRQDATNGMCCSRRRRVLVD
jgi:hypothetical protein